MVQPVFICVGIWRRTNDQANRSANFLFADFQHITAADLIEKGVESYRLKASLKGIELVFDVDAAKLCRVKAPTFSIFRTFHVTNIFELFPGPS